MSQGFDRSSTVEQVKSEVRQTIEELRVLARAAIPFDQFCHTLLQKIVPLTGAHGGIVWKFHGEQGFQPVSGFGPRHQMIPVENQSHQQMLVEVLRGQQPLCVASESVTDLPDAANMLLIAVPILDRHSRAWGSLELLQRGDINEETQRGYIKFTSQIATLFSRWQEQTELRTASSTQEQWADRVTFMREIHKTVDLDDACYAIANETRRLLHADRVSVATESGAQFRIRAVSSQDKFDNRANVVKRLNAIVTSSIRTSTPLWLTGDTTNLPPKLASKINEYLDESHSRTFAVIPLLLASTVKKTDELRRQKERPAKKIGGLIIEYFDQEVSETQIEQDLKLVRDETTQALGNALVTHEVFLLPLFRAMGKLRDTLWTNYRWRTIASLVLIGLITGLLCFYPAAMRLKVDGVLQPVIRKNLFTEVDQAVIETVHFDYGEQVHVNDLLITLRSPRLDQAYESLQNQITEAGKKLENLNRQLLQDRGDREDNRMELNAQINVLKSQIEGYRREQEIVQRQREALKIFSPIDGVILTWDAKHRLQDLPVEANQPVLSVADLNGPWRIELMIPQSKVGYISQALKDRNDALPADFLLSTNPNVRHSGNLSSISDRAEVNPQGTPEFRGIVDFDKSQLPDPKVGAGVTCRVDCGRQPLGFVWFYQIYDFARTRLFF